MKYVHVSSFTLEIRAAKGKGIRSDLKKRKKRIRERCCVYFFDFLHFGFVNMVLICNRMLRRYFDRISYSIRSLCFVVVLGILSRRMKSERVSHGIVSCQFRSHLFHSVLLLSNFPFLYLPSGVNKLVSKNV